MVVLYINIQSEDGSLILLETTTKKDKKTEFPGIARSTKGYDRVAFVSAKKGTCLLIIYKIYVDKIDMSMLCLNKYNFHSFVIKT